MQLDFGRVKTYRSAGFGFISGFLSTDIFFRIEKITDENVKNALKANEDCKSLSDVVCFWYAIEKTAKGDRVKKVYRDVQNIPEDDLLAFIDKLHESIVPTDSSFPTRYISSCSSHGSSWSGTLGFYSQLFADTRIIDDKLQIFIDFIGAKKPEILLSFIRESQKDAFKLSIENRWKNINQPLPDSIDKTTCELLGNEQYNALFLARQKEKEVLTKDLLKKWKDITLPLPHNIKEITLKTLGNEQYNLLLSERLLVKQNPRFIVQDRIATDKYTGLTWCRYTIWEGIYPKGFKKEEVIQAVKEFNEYGGEGGFTDWRLPTISELGVLTELRRLELIESGIQIYDKKEWAYLDKTVFPDAAVYVSGFDRYSSLNPNNYYIERVWGRYTASDEVFVAGVYYYGSDYHTGDGRSRTNSIRLVRGEPLFDMSQVVNLLSYISNLKDLQS